MHFLVAHAQKGLQQHLIRELYKEDLFSEMMREREDISARRAQCLEQLSALRRALAALDQLPETLVRCAPAKPTAPSINTGAVAEAFHVPTSQLK